MSELAGTWKKLQRYPLAFCVNLKNVGLIMIKRAVQYVRSATTGNNESLKDQLKSTSDYAKFNDYKIVRGPFVDDGGSGLDTKSRPAFERMIRLIESQKAKFSYIIMADISRWGRFIDYNEAIGLEYICKRHGVQLVFVNGGFTLGASFRTHVLKRILMS